MPAVLEIVDVNSDVWRLVRAMDMVDVCGAVCVTAGGFVGDTVIDGSVDTEFVAGIVDE